MRASAAMKNTTPTRSSWGQPAENQEEILAKFEADGWPTRIENPLYDNGSTKRGRRLHDAIKGLNHHQQPQLIRFLSDGNGLGVTWEPIDEE
jgi:hypothetical protein